MQNKFMNKDMYCFCLQHGREKQSQTLLSGKFFDHL